MQPTPQIRFQAQQLLGPCPGPITMWLSKLTACLPLRINAKAFFACHSPAASLAPLTTTVAHRTSTSVLYRNSYATAAHGSDLQSPTNCITCLASMLELTSPDVSGSALLSSSPILTISMCSCLSLPGCHLLCLNHPARCDR